MVGIGIERSVLVARIEERCRLMLERGWKEEALKVREAGGFGKTAVQALGYREVLAWADGELDRDQAWERIAARTRRFARRQGTWFRKFDVRWVADESGGEAQVEGVLRELGW